MLTSNLALDLRNPLCSIQDPTQSIARNALLVSIDVERIDLILRETQRMTPVLDKFRAVTCPLSGLSRALVVLKEMPRTVGMTLQEGLRAKPSAPRTILITADGSEQHAVHATKLGAYDDSSKPFDVEEVIEAVERAVACVRTDQENELLRAGPLLSKYRSSRSTECKASNGCQRQCASGQECRVRGRS